MKTMRSCILLAAAFLMFSRAALAQYTLYYSTNGDAITLTNYSGTPVDLTIPGFVTTVGSNAFSECEYLTNVTIGNGVTSIGEAAFFDCTNLASVTVGNSVTNIGDWAFELCTNLASATITNSVTSIGEGAFSYTSLTNVTIPNDVTNIGDYAFEGCSRLTSVTIPSSITTIGDRVFSACVSLTNVTIPNSVTGIGEQAFSGTSLGSLTVPNSVTSIGVGAFFLASLTNVTIGNSVTNIGEYAFEDCANLATVYFTGNAPPSGSSCRAFDADPATIYYLPGTTGWTSTFGDCPTVLWYPPNLLTNGAFGLQSNQFGFTITGPTNLPVTIQAITDLATGVWTNLQTVTLTNGATQFTDPASASNPSKYYRIAYPSP